MIWGSFMGTSICFAEVARTYLGRVLAMSREMKRLSTRNSRLSRPHRLCFAEVGSEYAGYDAPQCLAEVGHSSCFSETRRAESPGLNAAPADFSRPEGPSHPNCAPQVIAAKIDWSRPEGPSRPDCAPQVIAAETDCPRPEGPSHPNYPSSIRSSSML